MGREIRMVPPNWQHPQRTDSYGRTGLQPMHDRTFAEAAKEWKDGFAAWERGERPAYCTDEDHRTMEYWEWNGGPPEDRAYYRPWSPEEATWVQVWETVSEGTPVTPPFATKEELIAHLVKYGDDWDRNRGHGGWPEKNARKFVEDGWAPSMIVVQSAAGNQIFTARDGRP